MKPIVVSSLSLLCCATMLGQTSAGVDISALRQVIRESQDTTAKWQASLKILTALPEDTGAISILEDAAKEVVDYTGPSFEVFSNGKLGGPSQAFVVWCESKGIEPKAEMSRILQNFVQRIVALRLIPKSSALPLLRQGLRSSMATVAGASAVTIRDWGESSDIDLMLQELEAHRMSAEYSNLEAAFVMGLSQMSAADTHLRLQQFLRERSSLAAKFQSFRKGRQRSVQK